MDIIRQQQDQDGLWHFKIGGIASDSLYRLADLSRETTSPADWLAANQAEAQAAIDTGVYDEETDRKRDWAGLGAAVANELDWLDTTIPTIDAMTVAQVRSVVKRLAQENRDILKALRYVVIRMK